MTFIGIDVHKRDSQICILKDGGEIIEHRIRTDRARFAEVMHGIAPAKVLIEASTESEWVARSLESIGFEVIVADPNFAAMYATRSRRTKTDRRDARTLAEACQLGAYRSSYRVSDARRRLRNQVAVREALTRARTKFISVVSALLRAEGHRPRSGTAETFHRRITELQLPDVAKQEIAPLMTSIAKLDEQLGAADDHLAASAHADTDAKLLMSVPSVGPVTACAFVAAVDRAERFERAHQFEAYLGLVPSEMSSGEKQRKGGITKAGNTRLRWLLVQAALSTMRLKRPDTAALWQWAERIVAKRGRNVAMVALARRLAGVLFAVMRHRRPFNVARFAIESHTGVAPAN